METNDVALSSVSNLSAENEVYSRHKEELRHQDEMREPIIYALKSKSSDPDTLHLHEAMKEPDADHFVDAIIKGINRHSENNHWEVIPAD